MAVAPFQLLRAEELSTDDMVELLKKGGYVLYLRHGATDHAAKDRDLTDLRECANQRNLSQQGKQESRTLGLALRKLGIEIGDVRSSPFCRCVDTALYAFDRVTIDPQLRSSGSKDQAGNLEPLLRSLSELLSRRPAAGTNTVLVGHTANLLDVAQIWPDPEGVVHIFEPRDQSYQHIGRIPPGYWDAYLTPAPSP